MAKEVELVNLLKKKYTAKKLSQEINNGTVINLNPKVR